MPIICIRTYEARCDGSHNRSDWPSACDFSLDNVLDKEDALQRALDAGWVQKGKKLYCPSCAVALGVVKEKKT